MKVQFYSEFFTYPIYMQIKKDYIIDSTHREQASIYYSF